MNRLCVCLRLIVLGAETTQNRSLQMIVPATDCVCDKCGGVVEIIDCDDAYMTVCCTEHGHERFVGPGEFLCNGDAWHVEAAKLFDKTASGWLLAWSQPQTCDPDQRSSVAA